MLLQVSAAMPTFQMAFDGKESALAENLDVSSSGLLLKLQDRKIIKRNQRKLVEVMFYYFTFLYHFSV